MLLQEYLRTNVTWFIRRSTHSKLASCFKRIDKSRCITLIKLLWWLNFLFIISWWYICLPMVDETHLLHSESLNLRCDDWSVQSTILRDTASACEACEKYLWRLKLFTRDWQQERMAAIYTTRKATEILKPLFVEPMLFCSIKLTTSTESWQFSMYT